MYRQHFLEYRPCHLPPGWWDRTSPLQRYSARNNSLNRRHFRVPCLCGDAGGGGGGDAGSGYYGAWVSRQYIGVYEARGLKRGKARE